MGNWGIIVPVAATNYIHNPAFRYGTDGWANYSTETASGTRTRTTDNALKGYHSYQIDKTSAADTGDYGAADTVAGFDDFDSGDVLALSAYVVVEDGARVTLEAEITNAGGSETVTVSQDGAYTGRIEATGTLTADATAITVRIYIPDDYAGYVYVTGVQLEKDQITTYFDGFSEGCEWSGAWSESNSTRPVTARLGGIETDFDDYSFYITGATGLSAAEIGNNVQEFSNLPGGFFERSRSPIRSGALIGELIGTSLANLHSLRASLLEAFNPSIAEGNEVTIYYDGSGTRVYLDVMLDGGFGTFGRNGFNERLSVRLKSLSPYWYLGYQESAELTSTSDILVSDEILAYLDDTGWHAIGATTGAKTIWVIKVRKGKLYIGGSFGVIDGVSNTDYFAVYDGSSWSTFGTGVNGTVRAIEFDPDGNIYVGGDFTSCGGVANTSRIAYWDGSTWNAVDGASINNDVYALKYDPIYSRMYVGGTQTDFNYLCKFSPPTGAVSNVGVVNQSSAVYAIDIDVNGDVYYGGAFANVGGDADMSYIAKYDYDAGTHNELGTGTNGIVYSVLVHSSGDVYIGGAFTSVSGESIPRLAKWSGETWHIAGDADVGFSTGNVYELCETKEGNVLIAGTMGVSHPFQDYASRTIMLKGDIFQPLTANPNNTIYSIGSGDRYSIIIPAGGSTFYAGGLDTVENSGSVDTTIIAIRAKQDTTTYAMTHLLIDNINTEKKVYYLRRRGNDELLITNMNNKLSVSTDRFPQAIRFISPLSDLSGFKLLGGNNAILCHAETGLYDPDDAVSLYWIPEYWSADGA